MIQVHSLSKTFKVPRKDPGLKGALKGLFSRKYDTIQAVDDVSFAIGEGELVGYIGANGAGKSTTIKMMSGILVPSSGTCTINGIEPYKNRRANAYNIGVVFGQRTQLWWDLPLRESFTILKKIYRVSEEDFQDRMAFLESVLELNKFIASPVRTLSLGQRMRADLAASLIHNPPVLFLDEPTIGLDVLVKSRIRDAIKELNRRFRTTVILTTHDMSDIEELCHRLIMIDQGRILFDGPLSRIRENFGNMRTLEVDLRHPYQPDSLDFDRIFQLEPGSISLKTDSHRLTIRFPGQQVSAVDIIKKIQEKDDILDFRLKETEIEEIVKKIYSEDIRL